MSHTPGPWKWNRYKVLDDGPWHCVLESEAPIEQIPHRDRMVLPMRKDCAQFPYAGTLPNHLLISAAPDLLEACKALTEALRWHFIPLVERYASAQSAHGKDDVIEQALAAIAKAEGR